MNTANPNDYRVDDIISAFRDADCDGFEKWWDSLYSGTKDDLRKELARVISQPATPSNELLPHPGVKEPCGAASGIKGIFCTLEKGHEGKHNATTRHYEQRPASP